MKAIIQSMTNAERENPNILNAGVEKTYRWKCQMVQSINQLIRQFDEMEADKMMKKFNNPAALKMKRRTKTN